MNPFVGFLYNNNNNKKYAAINVTENTEWISVLALGF